MPSLTRWVLAHKRLILGLWLVVAIATAPGGGILLAATLIRGVLAPAAVAILGRWNWWLPRRPARLLRVEPSAALPETA